MKLVFSLICIFLMAPSVFSASAQINLKKYNCEITFKEPAVGFSDKKNADTERIKTRVVYDVVAVNPDFAFQKMVDKEVKAEIDKELTISTGLYIDSTAEAQPREKQYKEYKSIACN